MGNGVGVGFGSMIRSGACGMMDEGGGGEKRRWVREGGLDIFPGEENFPHLSLSLSPSHTHTQTRRDGGRQVQKCHCIRQ